MNGTTEIAQLQETSIINDYDEVDIIGIDVSCNLGSLDVHNAVKEQDFGRLIYASMSMLTAVSEMTEIKNVPSVARGNKLMHSVGLGVMNVHGHFVTEGIMYGSDEANEFLDAFFTALNYYSIKASMEFAKQKKQKFYRFEDSEYANGNFFEPYYLNELTITSEKVKKALGNVPIITIEQWKQLEEDVKQYGMINAYRLAVAPTGSISYIRSSSASMSPITERVEVRDYADSRTIYPMPFLDNDNQHLYQEAYDIDQYKMIDSYAVAQKHVDQAISMTLYIKDTWNTEELAKLYIYAWLKGIKSVYYVRQRMQTIDECVACSV